MTEIYIDFDGVIVDTWNLIYNEYKKKYKTTEINELKIKKTMLDLGWNFILNNSRIIQGSIQNIHLLSKKYKVYILSKVNSIEEKNEKIKFLQNKGINEAYFVPYDHSKTEYVTAKDNILIDDDLKNLEEWFEAGGKGIFFNEFLKDCDSYGQKNTKFLIIDNLLKICDII